MNDDTSSSFPRRYHVLLLGLLIAIGFLLRAAYPDRMAVEHFDEGVYASNWFCHPPGLPDHTFPQQHLYAPPFLPALYEWVLIFSGSHPHSVMWVNVLLGTLMIPVMWGIGRSWFGPIAGFVAAGLCAFSGPHLFFSRAALTDVPLCLFLTAGVWSGWRAIVSGRPLWIGLAGGLAALAWWTKYNGWLTLAITGAGLAGWLLFTRPKLLTPWAGAMRWGGIVLIACVLWSPVPLSLEDAGGYSAVAENHAKYVTGFSGWWQAARQQMASFRVLNSFPDVLGTLAVLVTGLILTGPKWRDRSIVEHLAVVLLLGWILAAGWISGVEFAMFGLAVFALAKRCWESRAGAITTQEPVSIVSGREARSLAVWMIAAWLVGLTLSTPMYTPYPRLALPWLVSVWLGMSLFVFHATDLLFDLRTYRLRAGLTVVLLSGVMMSLGLLQDQVRSRDWLSPLSWNDRRGMRMVAEVIVEELVHSADVQAKPGVEGYKAVVYVLAEPALFYHLSEMEPASPVRYFVQPIGDLSLLTKNRTDSRMATYLAVGPESRLTNELGPQKVRAIRPIPFSPSPLTLLDRTGPTSDFHNQLSAVVLYHVP